MAEEMLARFEELFKPVQERIDGLLDKRREKDHHEFKVSNELPFREVDELQGSSWNNHGCQVLAAKKSKPKASHVPVSHIMKKSVRMPSSMQARSTISTASNPPPSPMNPQPSVTAAAAAASEPLLPPSPVRAPPLPATKEQKAGRVAAPKQPKPRAKDLNKRDMSMDEKQKLGIGLQSLPQEKMPHIVPINMSWSTCY